MNMIRFSMLCMSMVWGLVSAMHHKPIIFQELDGLLGSCDYPRLKTSLRQYLASDLSLIAQAWINQAPQSYDLCVINTKDYWYYHMYQKSCQVDSGVLFDVTSLAAVFENMMREYIRAFQEDCCVQAVFKGYPALVDASSIAPRMFVLKACYRWYPLFKAYQDIYQMGQKEYKKEVWEELLGYRNFVAVVLEACEKFHNETASYPGIPLITTLVDFKTVLGFSGSWELNFLNPIITQDSLKFVNYALLKECHDLRGNALKMVAQKLQSYASWQDFFRALIEEAKNYPKLASSAHILAPQFKVETDDAKTDKGTKPVTS